MEANSGEMILLKFILILAIGHSTLMEHLLDVDELAGYLKLKKQTIYNWLNQRKISGIKMGGVWRFERREIDKWLKAQSRKMQ